MSSPTNFGFLEVHDAQLVRLGILAERYFRDDPNTCLIKLRQYGEVLAKLTAANVGLGFDPRGSQDDLLRLLARRTVIQGRVSQLFHELRKTGNVAVHGLAGDSSIALTNLRYARELGIWFHRTFSGDRTFNPGPFIPPPNPVVETEALRQELERLRAEVQTSQVTVATTQSALIEESQRRLSAEELAQEIQNREQELLNRLNELQAAAVNQPEVVKRAIQRAQRAERRIVLDEWETRRLIDSQLREAGWETDSEQLTYTNGTRPQVGRNMAIAEYPTRNGRADYILFIGLQAVAVVEAKRQSTDVPTLVEQAERYSRGFQVLGQGMIPGGPWGEFQVPFAFATNGRAYLAQLRTKSGIWFRDLRRNQNLSRPLPAWYTPQGFVALLAQDVEQAQQQLQQETFDYDLKLWEHQIAAIQAVETALADDQRSMLLAMATGTGKTKTAIALCYRLLKTRRFRRILFLVDRTALGEQTEGEFQETRIEGLRTFAEIFDLKGLNDTNPDPDTKVHIATIQGLVKRILNSVSEVPPVDQYDCIIVDECHRGYLQDNLMTDVELEFRDFNDYISKYRRVLEYFDAVKIGLTATPALHTTQIFGDPIYRYSYRQAVRDGRLIDHEPPILIRTNLAEEGIVWNRGDEMEFFNPQTGELDLVHAPDTLKIEVDDFNRRVLTQEFNRVVCQELARNIDPSLPGKILIFCATDGHADTVVDQMRLALEEQYGSIDNDVVVKITGQADKPAQLIRRYRNEAIPKIAVTVDLLTTGIDVPEICTLVFIRRINSRILYEQMLGRATRRCDEIGKEVFQIFDAVNICAPLSQVSEMQPVVDPKIPFTQLIDELETISDPAIVQAVVDQLIAKLQRKKKRLSDANQDQIEALAGMPLEDMVDFLSHSTPQEVKEWFQDRAAIAEILDRRNDRLQPILVSHHVDELRRVERSYGEVRSPQEYIDLFKTFLTETMEAVPALGITVQNPQELTRQQLKAIQAHLDGSGFSDRALQVAWQELTQEEVAASTLGFVRYAVLDEELQPYGDRVDRAIKQVLASQSWTSPQRTWLNRIGKQIKLETILDRETFDQGSFKEDGGFERFNRIFEGRLEEILANIHQAIWQD